MLRRRTSVISERSLRQARVILDSISSENRRSLSARRRMYRGLLWRRRIAICVFSLLVITLIAGLFNEFIVF